jgi:ribosomal protein S18 acetylase RimI-like enzyme
MSIKLIHFIEELAANAWTAAVVQVVDGWRLRFNWRVTQRANSVWPNESQGELDLEAKLQLVEDFYTRHGMRARYQMCPATQPAELDDVLAQRGYIAVSHTSVQIAPIETVIQRAQANQVSDQVAVPVRPVRAAVSVRAAVELRREQVVCVGNLDDEWFATYAEGAHMADHERAMRRGILERIGPRAGYALVRMEERPVAVGVGVVERGWAGIYCMETLPKFRRRGAATAVIGALAQWVQTQGARQMYLQVMLNNAPARALYAGLGFKPLHTYHYRDAGS